MAKYGDYNGNLVIDENLESLDTKTTKGTSAIRKTIVSNYTSSEMKKGPYIGYVLRKDVLTKEKAKAKGFFDRVGEIFSSNDSVITYKVRIPEIDCHIPEPENYASPKDSVHDVTYIDMHPTYFLPKDSGGKQDFEPGSKVLVERDEINQVNNVIIKIVDENNKEPIKKEGAKKCYKKSGKNPTRGRTGEKNAIPNTVPVDASELEKWNAYSGNSGNPLNIDIVTKTINGQLITFSRKTMAKYEGFVALWNERRKEIVAAGHNDPGDIQYEMGEAFRIWGGFYPDDDLKRKRPFGNGKFRDSPYADYDPSRHHISKQRGTHTAGNAVDVDVPHARFIRNKEAGRNYVNLIVHCAQHNGFVRFGIGRFTNVHMDTGERANGIVEGKYSWVYDLGPGRFEYDTVPLGGGKVREDNKTIGYWTKRKLRHIKNGYMSEEWGEASKVWGPNPPNLRDWDYLKGPY